MSITIEPHRYERKVVTLDNFRRTLASTVSNIASLAILAALLLAVWVAFSFVRVSLAGGEGSDDPPSQVAPPGQAPGMAAGSVPATLAKREPLVYLAEGDAAYFHLCGHNPSGASRHALPAAMARSRGFAPCPDCFRQARNDR
jgi:hypothetical protein